MYSIDVSRNDKKIVFAAGKSNTHIYLYDLVNLTIKELTKSSINELSPSFSQDGSKIVFIDGDLKPGIGGWPKKTRLKLLDLVTGKIETIFEKERTICDDPSFAPDGKKIVFVGAYLESPLFSRSDVWEYDVKKKSAERLTFGSYRAGLRPRYIDQQNVVFDADKPNEEDKPLYLCKMSTIERKINIISRADYKTYCPYPINSKNILCISDCGVAFDDKICILNLDTKKYEIIHSPNGEGMDNLVYCPEGIVYWLQGNVNIWKMNIKTRIKNKIADKFFFEEPLKWKPKK